MRNRRPALDHTEAVARRLAELSAELEAERAAEALHPESFDAADSLAGGVSDGVAERTVPRIPVLAVPVGPALPLRDQAPVTPGRHAARRRAPLGAGLRDDDERGWGPGQVGVVLGGVVLALAVTCLWLLFGTTQEVVTPVAARVDAPVPTAAAPSSSPASQSAVASSAPASSEPAEVVVDVSGKVKRPGLVVLPSGSRVADAVEKAGGARAGVDLTGLNLARVLVDGEQILVGVPPSAGGVVGAPAGTSAAPGASGGSGGGPVSINSADEALLDSLPGVGPVTAAAIVAWRTQHGGFVDVRDLLEVKGIGEATLAELLPHVTL